MAERGGRTKYEQIANQLRDAITSGQYRPGDRLPSENDLMSRHGVARMTARGALEVLRNEGLTVARRGAGVFVREFQPVVRQVPDRLAVNRWGAGRSIWGPEIEGRTFSVDMLEVYEDQAPDRITKLLELGQPAQVWVRHRRYSVDDKPVLRAVSFLPAELVAGSAITSDNPGPGGIYARLKDLGYAPARFQEELRARMPHPDEIETLALAPGTPVIAIIRIAYTAPGRPVEVNEMVLDAWAYVLRYKVEA